MDKPTFSPFEPYHDEPNSRRFWVNISGVGRRGLFLEDYMTDVEVWLCDVRDDAHAQEIVASICRTGVRTEREGPHPERYQVSVSLSYEVSAQNKDEADELIDQYLAPVLKTEPKECPVQLKSFEWVGVGPEPGETFNFRGVVNH